MKIPRMLGILSVVVLIAAIGGIMLVKSVSASELKGTLESISPDGTSVVVDGQTIIVTPDTKIEDTLVVGSAVEVKFIEQNDGSLLALKVDVDAEEDVNVDEDNDQDEDVNDDQDVNDEDVELKGVIESVSPDGTSIVVDGQTIIITPDTEIEGMLAVGSAIEATVVAQADGSLVAQEVEVSDGGDVDQDVNGEDVEVDTSTDIDTDTDIEVDSGVDVEIDSGPDAGEGTTVDVEVDD